MSQRPNILFLMTDQMQGRVLHPEHPCRTPHFDQLRTRGLHFTRAYTPNAVCSPARASLMTGMLPHNHGVLSVTHTADDDQSCLRTAYPHWAQRLEEAGYCTGYFGKWHVERSGDLGCFGWQVDGGQDSERLRRRSAQAREKAGAAMFSRQMFLENPGYERSRFYGVTSHPPELRPLGVRTGMALDFLDQVLEGSLPWCCFVSINEPHDPFICGEQAFALYDPDALELSPSLDDDLEGRPGIYRKAAGIWQHMSKKQHREAAACYYASITEIDQQYGRLLERVEQAGQLDNTLVVLTSDHGESLGAHGLYCKNFSASEEIYNIPLLAAGPGVPAGARTRARVGLHDLGPTLLEAAGCPPLEKTDARSFAGLLADPAVAEDSFTRGYAEYFGGRMILTQRVVWDGPWKLVFNGFDFDELYNLDRDPNELCNLASLPEYRPRLEKMCALLWRYVRESGDHSLLNSHYPVLRVAPFGPLIGE